MAQTIESILQTIAHNNQILSEQVAKTLSSFPTHGESKKTGGVRLDTFSNHEGESYEQWAFHVEMSLQAKELHPPQSIYTILGALRGQALDIGRSLKEQITHYSSNQDFLTALRSLFVSPAHQHQARALFERRIQEKGESVKVFHGLLLQLFNDAFNDKERREADIIDHFVSGLQDRNIRSKLHDLRVINMFPATYTKVLDICLYYMAEKEKIAIEDGRIRSGGYVSNGRANRNTQEPMDINSCKIHPSSTHTNDQCRQQSKKKNGQVKTSQSKTNFNNNNNNSNSAKSNDKCYKCNKNGHWAKDCRSNIQTVRAYKLEDSVDTQDSGNSQLGALEN
jgi:hypothetical protein